MINSVSSPFMLSTRKQPPIQFGGRGTLLTKNLGQVRKDFFYNLQNDTATFQNNALLYASLVLVISRMYALRKSVKKAKGTVDENYRKSEAIKTSLREIGGFSFSFIVLRMFQSIIGKRIAKFFGLNKYDSLTEFTAKHFRDAFIWAFIKKKPLYTKQEYFTPTLRYPDNPKNLEKMQEYYAGVGIDKFFKDKTLHLSGEAKARQVFRNIRTMYVRLPIILGSIPAIILSGFLLEHFTQKHANRLAKKTEQWLNRKNHLPSNTDVEHLSFTR